MMANTRLSYLDPEYELDPDDDCKLLITPPEEETEEDDEDGKLKLLPPLLDVLPIRVIMRSIDPPTARDPPKTSSSSPTSSSSTHSPEAAAEEVCVLQRNGTSYPVNLRVVQVHSSSSGSSSGGSSSVSPAPSPTPPTELLTPTSTSTTAAAAAERSSQHIDQLVLAATAAATAASPPSAPTTTSALTANSLPTATAAEEKSHANAEEKPLSAAASAPRFAHTPQCVLFLDIIRTHQGGKRTALKPLCAYLTSTSAEDAAFVAAGGIEEMVKILISPSATAAADAQPEDLATAATILYHLCNSNSSSGDASNLLVRLATTAGAIPALVRMVKFPEFDGDFYAMSLLKQMAKAEDSWCQEIVDAGATKLLLDSCCYSGVDAVKSLAATLLRYLCITQRCREELADSEVAVTILIRLLAHGRTGPERSSALILLRCLLVETTDEADFFLRLYRGGGIPALVRILLRGSASEQLHASVLLRAIASGCHYLRDDSAAPAAAGGGGRGGGEPSSSLYASLVQILKDSDATAVQLKPTLALLRGFTDNFPSACDEIAFAQGIPPLLGLLRIRRRSSPRRDAAAAAVAAAASGAAGVVQGGRGGEVDGDDEDVAGELRELATWILRAVASHRKYHVVIIGGEGLGLLGSRLEFGSTEEQTNCAVALMHLSRSSNLTHLIVGTSTVLWGLLHLLETGTTREQKWIAIRTLNLLSAKGAENRKVIVEADAVPYIARLLLQQQQGGGGGGSGGGGEREAIQLNCVRTLRNLAAEPSLREKIGNTDGGLDALIRVLLRAMTTSRSSSRSSSARHGLPRVVSEAALAISLLSIDSDNKKALSARATRRQSPADVTATSPPPPPPAPSSHVGSGASRHSSSASRSPAPMTFLQAIIALLREGKEEGGTVYQMAAAASALKNLSVDPDMREVILRDGGFGALLEVLLSSDDVLVLYEVTAALHNLTTSRSAAEELLRYNGSGGGDVEEASAVGQGGGIWFSWFRPSRETPALSSGATRIAELLTISEQQPFLQVRVTRLIAKVISQLDDSKSKSAKKLLRQFLFDLGLKHSTMPTLLGITSSSTLTQRLSMEIRTDDCASVSSASSAGRESAEYILEHMNHHRKLRNAMDRMMRESNASVATSSGRPSSLFSSRQSDVGVGGQFTHQHHRSSAAVAG